MRVWTGVHTLVEINTGTVALATLDHEDDWEDGPLHLQKEGDVSGNGNGCGFRPDEVVVVQGRSFPIIGGRLRIVHEMNEKVSIGTELVDYAIDQHAVVRASVETGRGRFTATGTSSAARDPKLADSIIELAETRAVARALRFGGIGTEVCGFEELGAGEVLEGNAPKQLTNNHHDSSQVQNGHRGNGNGHHTPATSAQRRAILSLAHKLGLEPDDAVAKMFTGIGFDDLSLGQASQLIDKMKAKTLRRQSTVGWGSS